MENICVTTGSSWLPFTIYLPSVPPPSTLFQFVCVDWFSCSRIPCKWNRRIDTLSFLALLLSTIFFKTTILLHFFLLLLSKTPLYGYLVPPLLLLFFHICFISSTCSLTTLHVFSLFVVVVLTVCIILIIAPYLTLIGLLRVNMTLHTLNLTIPPSLSLLTLNTNFSLPTSCSCSPLHKCSYFTILNSICLPLLFSSTLFFSYVCYKYDPNECAWTWVFALLV